jgi:hypothetical protein
MADRFLASSGIEAIVGTDANAEKQELARRIAEAHIDLRRVRRVRHQLLSQALHDPDYVSKATRRVKAAIAAECLQRYGSFGPVPKKEKCARSRRKFAIRAFDAACACQ